MEKETYEELACSGTLKIPLIRSDLGCILIISLISFVKKFVDEYLTLIKSEKGILLISELFPSF